jgi:hypothetical protein
MLIKAILRGGLYRYPPQAPTHVNTWSLWDSSSLRMRDVSHVVAIVPTVAKSSLLSNTNPVNLMSLCVGTSVMSRLLLGTLKSVRGSGGTIGAHEWRE